MDGRLEKSLNRSLSEFNSGRLPKNFSTPITELGGKAAAREQGGPPSGHSLRSGSALAAGMAGVALRSGSGDPSDVKSLIHEPDLAIFGICQ